MTNLILTPYNQRLTPIADVIGDAVNDTIVITALENTNDYQGFLEVIGVNNYFGSYEVEAHAAKLIEMRNVDKIACLSEFDLIRAAGLREKYGFDGQSIQSAIAFRDKIVMKEIISEAHINTPFYTPVASYLDIERFIKKHNYPVVIKPRDGAGAANTFIIHDERQLFNVFANNTFTNMMIETFVSQDMYHVDGIYNDGEIIFCSVSKYIGSTLDHLRSKSLGSAHIAAENPIQSRIKIFLERTLDAMPCPDYTPFHLEVFEEKDGTLTFCEIASRVGGPRINDCLKKYYQVDIQANWLAHQLGLRHLENHSWRMIQPHFGWVLIAPKNGILSSICDKDSLFDWICELEIYKKVGDQVFSAVHSMESVASYFVEGGSEQELVNRIRMSVLWFEERFHYNSF